MATAGSKMMDCRLVTVRSLELKTGDKPDSAFQYQGLVVSSEKIIVIDQKQYNVQIYGHDGKLIAISGKLMPSPRGICLMNENEICVILLDGTIEIMSFKCTGDTVSIKRESSISLNKKLSLFYAVTKHNDKLIICGRKGEKTMYWCPVTLNVTPNTDHIEKLYKICDGYGWSNLTTNNNIIYIACYAGHLSSNNGVYSYSFDNPETQLAKYNHHDLHCPQGIAVDSEGFVFVCNEGEPACIHHLTAELKPLRIYQEEMPSNPYSIFWCPKQGNLYLTSPEMLTISQYRPEYNSQQDEGPSSSTVMPPVTSAVMASIKADTITTATESQSLASNVLTTQSTSTEVPATSTTLAEPTTNDTATTTRGEDGGFLSWLRQCCCCRKKQACRYSQGVPVGYCRIKHILYQKNGILGYGSYGTIVYQGRFDRRDVAVKRMQLEYYRNVEREVKILLKAENGRQHPNVVRYFFSEKDSSFYYIALELCAGTLETYVKEMYNEKEVVPLLDQILSGLEHLHSLKIVHRDLKPKNILMSARKDQGEVRAMISDFGLSRILDLNETTSSDTLGTIGWIAPEMWEIFENKEKTKSKRTLTCAADIFSFGCIVHYLFTQGGHPFGNDEINRHVNIRGGNYNLDNLPETSDGKLAKDIIEKMLSPAPGSRPSAKEVLHSPLFWTAEKKLKFIEEASDWINDQKNDPTHVQLVNKLEQDGGTIVNVDWKVHICTELQNDKHVRKSDGSKVETLLRLIRNKKHHYHAQSESLKNSLGPPPEHFLEYFTSKFPSLIARTYHAMRVCDKEHTFKCYY